MLTPLPKRPITAKTLRALLMTCTPAERITFGKVVIESLIDQKNGVYDLIRILVLNLSDEESASVNAQIRRVKETFNATPPGETRAQLTPPRQSRDESKTSHTGGSLEDVPSP